MQNMEPNEGTIYPAMRINQSKVGALIIEAMAFPTTYPEPHIRFAHEIRILDGSKTQSSWGDEIFRGSLKELIDLVNQSKKEE